MQMLDAFGTYSIVLSFQWHLLTQHAGLDFCGVYLVRGLPAFPIMQCFLLVRQDYGQCGQGKLNMT